MYARCLALPCLAFLTCKSSSVICTGPDNLFPEPAPFSSSSLSRVRIRTCSTAMLVAVTAALTVVGSEPPPPPWALNASHATSTADRGEFSQALPVPALLRPALLRQGPLPPLLLPVASTSLLGKRLGLEFLSSLAIGRGGAPPPPGILGLLKGCPAATGVRGLRARETSSSPAEI